MNDKRLETIVLLWRYINKIEWSPKQYTDVFFSNDSHSLLFFDLIHFTFGHPPVLLQISFENDLKMKLIDWQSRGRLCKDSKAVQKSVPTDQNVIKKARLCCEGRDEVKTYKLLDKTGFLLVRKAKQTATHLQQTCRTCHQRKPIDIRQCNFGTQCCG